MNKDRQYWIQWEQRRNRVELLWQKRVFKALQKQARQFTRHLSRTTITQAKQDLKHVVTSEPVEAVLKALYIQAGVLQANVTYRQVRTIERQLLKFLGFGNNAEWTQAVQEYFRTNILSNAVLPITQTSRDVIEKILTQAMAEGWSVQKAVDEIERQTDEINARRARVITRTESVRAMNYGTMLGADKSTLVLDKRWITAHDERVRSSHRALDGQKIEMDAVFTNGCAFPGDPDGGAKETINCRCTIALVPKRDQNGRPIRKPDIRIPVYDRRAA